MYNNLNHIALILDGNKRWAKKNDFSSLYGYSHGFENIKKLVNYSLSINLPNLTIFALSSENFNRSSVNIIYDIIYDNFSKTFDDLIKNKGVKVNIFGSRQKLPNRIKEIFKTIENNSCANTSLNLNIAFNYGFKEEIKNVLYKFQNFKNTIDINDDNQIKKLFYLGLMPDPDILIRTGGYQRLSNFIMFNLTYTELFFTNTLWPDFSAKELQNIIDNFFKIKRKYGL